MNVRAHSQREKHNNTQTNTHTNIQTHTETHDMQLGNSSTSINNRQWRLLKQ